jgi:hypothetical protein
MPLPPQLATELAQGAPYSFKDWPNLAVPCATWRPSAYFLCLRFSPAARQQAIATPLRHWASLHCVTSKNLFLQANIQNGR